ncbi:MAG TPA: glutathione S-transferase family protein [Gaiellaceae bacterium]|nr:glutathione S-transferase family protein [Gaiellaceae bacterium]
MKLIDAPRCPYCARARIALAEKGLEYERVEVDLSDRPEWVIELNPPNGRVPVLDDGFVLPESEVVMEYLEDRYPDPPLLPDDAQERARARFLVNRFDDLLGRDYYAFRRGDENDLAAKLERLEVGQSLYADIAYAPWVIRAREMLGVALPPQLQDWLERRAERPAFAAELETVRKL